MTGSPHRLARLLAVLALGLAPLLLGGCVGVSSMEKTGLVSLMGLDTAPGGYRVTVAVLDPLGLPKPTGGGSGRSPELVRSAVGSSVADAVRHLAATTYLNLDFTHMRGIIVSEALARMGLAAPLEVIARSADFEETSLLFVARGESAADLVRASQDMMPDAGEVLFGTTTWAQHLFPTYADRVFGFLDQARTQGDQPATAGVALPSAQGQGPTLAFRLTGMALFRQDRLVGWLSGPESLGWLVATRRAKQQILAAPSGNGGTVTLEILRDRRRIRIVRTPQGPHADLQIDVGVQLLSAGGGPAAFWARPDALTQLQDDASGALTADVRGALRAAQAAGADVFSLGEYVRVQDPRDWYAARADWNADAFPRLPVSLRVAVTITSVGKILCPILQRC